MFDIIATYKVPVLGVPRPWVKTLVNNSIIIIDSLIWNAVGAFKVAINRKSAEKLKTIRPQKPV